MATTWESQQPQLPQTQEQATTAPTQPTVSVPEVKIEASPAESFMSAPGDIYPSLFSTPSTMNPLESVMTPESCTGDDKAASQASLSPSPSGSATESTEKKPAKKRKSWGQVLPEPKTNLPPRKRAKTEDEKEQRRVERVLRNRRAAQSSRERKRQEVEALERRNSQLEAALLNQQKQNMMLMEELTKLRRDSGVVSRSSSPLDGFQPSPLTLSQPLFGSSENASQGNPGMMNDFILMPEQDGTVDPASLSPELNPVSDKDVNESSTTTTTTTTTTETPAKASSAAPTSTDVTQHPAAVLCDLQCPSVEVPQSWLASRQPSPPALSLFLQLQTLLTVSSVLISACRRPLTLITGALKTNLALQPTPSILSTIIWLVTLPPNFRDSTSINSSAMMSAAPLRAQPREATRSPKNPNLLSASLTLRIKSLQKLLTSSPILARPLMDATMELLRLVSEGRDDQVEELASGSPGIKGDRSRGPLMWPEGTSLPSREVLLTLLWAIRVEERKLIAARGTNNSSMVSLSSPCSRPGSSTTGVLREKTPTTTLTQNHVTSSSPSSTILLVATKKRKRDMTEMNSGKRFRLYF
ncbi:hypothetical protein F4809DRAFT_504897 [Biscogniauxia mediterranea]|nr:hypothetical protein F4809DRAFT_504897 [Biscogniauxia mediterranea]